VGLRPTPRQGDDPPAPRYLGLRPKGARVCWRYLALALRSHLGLRPKTPREPLGAKPHFAESEASEKGQTPYRFLNKAKGCGVHTRRGPAFRRAFVSCLEPSPSRGAWGAAPNGNARPKQNDANKLYLPLGRSPNNGVQGTTSPAGVWGGAPHRSPVPSHAFLTTPVRRIFSVKKTMQKQKRVEKPLA